MGRVVEKGMVEVHLECLVRTYCCYCTLEVAVFVLVDIGPLTGALQGNMVQMLLVLAQQCVPGLEQLELGLLALFVCLEPQLAAVVACQGRVIG